MRSMKRKRKLISGGGICYLRTEKSGWVGTIWQKGGSEIMWDVFRRRNFVIPSAVCDELQYSQAR
jgi:hypothetical protein